MTQENHTFTKDINIIVPISRTIDNDNTARHSNKALARTHLSRICTILIACKDTQSLQQRELILSAPSKAVLSLSALLTRIYNLN